MGGNTSQQRIYSHEVKGSKQPGFSHIYRHEKAMNGLLGTPQPHLHSMKDVILQSVKKFSGREFMGNIVVDSKVVNGETVQQRSIHKYTYQQIFHMAENLGSFLTQNKMYFEEPKSHMRLVGIYSKNRLEWIVADIACILFGLTIIPLYDTLGVQNLTYCLDHSEINTCFVTAGTIPTLVKLKGKGNLTNIISFDQVSSNVVKELEQNKLKFFRYTEAIKKPKLMVNHENFKVNEKSCLTFSYTSGTTGPPKGAMLNHGNFLSFLSSFMAHQIGGFRPEDSHVSFLPLPHVFQRVVITSLIYSGCFISFYSGDVAKIKDDLAFMKPTIFVGVPRLFNKIVDALQKKFSEASGVKSCLVNNGVSSKMHELEKSGKFTSGFYDSVVFSKVRESFGGNIRLMLTGSAPIKKDVFNFMKIAMCCMFCEGYGQTENTAAAFITGIIDPECGHVGGIVAGLEFKLADIPEMNYTSNDKDEQGRPTPRGQIWLRGPAVFMGYYKDAEKTNQAITSDGWLKTGDVGMILPGNCAMKIIDRKKNIFKLAQGEYIAAEKVQAAYSKCPVVQQVFLHGHSTQSYALAVVSVNKDQFLKLASKNSLNGDFEQLCNDKKMRTLLCKQLDSVGKQNGLMSFEQAKNIHIDSKTFVERDIVTNTFKLQRFQAKKFYEKQINDMYSEGMLSIK